MDWQALWNKVVNYFESNIWNIVAFFATLIIGAILITIAVGVTKRLMRLRKVDEMAIRFVSSIFRFLLWLLLILILLSIMGVPISGLTTTLSAAVLAIGMALKEFLGNVASGIILVGSKKYKTGDYIQVAGVEGSIIDINFLFTTMKTPNSTQITLPNSTMVNSPVTNLGAYPARRIALTFSVAYDSDTFVVKKTLVDVMNSCGLVYENPAPACNLKVLNESSIDFFCTCFCDNSDYWTAYFYIMEHAFDELKRNGVSIPFKQVDVTIKDNTFSAPPLAYSSLPDRIEKPRTKRSSKPLTVDEVEDLSFRELHRRLKEQAEEFKEEREAKKASKKPKSSAPSKKKSTAKKKTTPKQSVEKEAIE